MIIFMIMIIIMIIIIIIIIIIHEFRSQIQKCQLLCNDSKTYRGLSFNVEPFRQA